jgi:putative transcriptional regulator
MPNISDPIFTGALIFICEHTKEGAMGIIVNRPLGLALPSLFKQLGVEISASAKDFPIYFGGPVQTNRGFILHKPLGNWQSTLAVSDHIGLTTSKDVLIAVNEGNGPDALLITLGHAQWQAGQLEQELAENVWLSMAADTSIIYNVPSDERYDAALKLLGVDRGMLNAEAGHA